MKVYKVGGCVRDRLLGLPVKDRDWVVVGSSVDEMLSQGFRPVGKDFPVFLHPQTQEEYALARTERKTAPGYHGFAIHASPEVTLEEDLARRDLTINAIAEDENGNIEDPFHGQADLQNKILRHVSPAFVEDPVRVLRLARFAARFGFQVASETRELIAQMIANGELQHLVAERVWQELEKALQTKRPSLFFYCLREVGALSILFPEIDRLFGVPQAAKWHPEVDTGVHVMLVLDQAARLSDDVAVRFAALCHDLGKGTTPSEMLPNHKGHETRSIQLTEELCERLRVPREISVLAAKVAEFHTQCHVLFELSGAEVLRVMEGLDAFRKPHRFAQYLLAAEADFRGRPGYEQTEMPEKAVFQICFDKVRHITAEPFLQAGLQGPAIRKAIASHRCQIIDDILEPYRKKS